MLHGEIGADQIDLQDFQPVLGVEFEKRFQAAADPGVGVDDIKPAEFANGRVDYARDIGLDRDVGLQRDGRAAASLIACTVSATSGA
jgi:hypothetical protein